MSRLHHRLRLLLGLSLATLGVACGGSGNGRNDTAPLAVTGTAYGTTSTNDLVTFLVDAPESILTTTPISGLQLGETIAGLDLRTGTGDLLALGTTGRLYRLNPTTAVATQLGSGPFATLAGSSFGFDIDPDTDQIHVVSDADENVRASAATGAFLGTDATLAYAAGDPNVGQLPDVVALAYTADSAGATTATAFVIDATNDSLVRLGGLGGVPSPATGSLTTIGALGVATGSTTAFDVASGSGRAYASLTSPTSSLYRIDLGTGVATLVGPVGAFPTILTGLAIVAEQAPMLLAFTSSGDLITFRADAPGTVLSSVPVSGLLTLGETLVGIDVRPATGQLYGVSSTSRLYRISRTTGVATAVGAPGGFVLAGSSYGIDFDPTTDRLRIVSDTEQNLRVNPNDGMLSATDAALQYAPLDPNFGANANVVGSAHTNSTTGATATALFGIDSNLDVLVTQSPPSSGTLRTVGSLGFDAGTLVGFEILASTGQAYASLTPTAAGSSRLFRVSLGTGVVSNVGTIGGGATVVGLTGIPEATSTVTLYVVDAANVLYRVNPEDSAVALGAPIAITGLALAESVLALEVRPANGDLLVLGSSSRLYSLDPVTGVATALGSPGVFTLIGTTFGLDVNPVTDVVRVTSDADQNLRLSPTGALLATDGTLAFALADPNFGVNPDVVASGYASSASGTSTVLYDIDATLNVLATQVPADAGTLNTVGPLGVTLTPGLSVGFDVAPFGGRSYASGTLVAESTARLFVVNLVTGALTTVGALPGASPIRGIAVQR